MEEIKNETMEEIKNENGNVVITDKTAKEKKKPFIKRVGSWYVEHRDKEQHPVAARLIRGGEIVVGGALLILGGKAYIDHEVEKGRIPNDLCENSYYPGDEESSVYEASAEDVTDKDSDEETTDSEEETKEETTEETAE